jgi:Down syndrome cell adhesion protein
VPNGEPQEIRVDAQSSTELLVSWEPPPREQWNGNILGYYVGFRERSLTSEPSSAPIFSPSLAPVTGSYSFKTVEASSGSRVVLTNLAKYTMYNIVVQAFNSRGAGPASDPVTARTMEDGTNT